MRSEVRVILETPRLRLCTWTEDDARDAFRLWGDPRVMALTGSPPLQDLEKAHCVVGRAIGAQQELGYSLWRVLEKGNGVLVGACGFHRYDEAPTLELAYHFLPEVWGRGYASEAVAGCLVYARQVLGIPRILALTDPANDASVRVLLKNGFVRIDEEGGEDVFQFRPDSGS